MTPADYTRRALLLVNVPLLVGTILGGFGYPRTGASLVAVSVVADSLLLWRPWLAVPSYWRALLPRPAGRRQPPRQGPVRYRSDDRPSEEARYRRASPSPSERRRHRRRIISSVDTSDPLANLVLGSLLIGMLALFALVALATTDDDPNGVYESPTDEHLERVTEAAPTTVPQEPPDEVVPLRPRGSRSQ